MISISAMHFHRLFFSRVSRGPSAFSWKLHLSATAPVRLISSAAKKSRPEGSAARSKKTQAASESEAFYVVQKGGITGVYRNFEDCKYMVSDPTCNVYKGHSLQKKVEDLLAARGMKNALYCISSMDLMGEFFGALAPCQGSENHIAVVEGRDVPKVAFDEHMDVSTDSVPLEQPPFVLEFDGSSKGNPGKAGAGAVIKSAKGNVISRVREGLGITTNNVAEYKALILGMKFCLKNGINEIRVKGDSKLVCMQLQGSWKTNAEHISALHKEAMELKKKFLFFEIKHVLRSLNSDADALANSAAELEGGVIAEDI